MSKVLDHWDFRSRGEATPGNAKYPWNEWLDGRIHRIARPDDFDRTPENMAAQVRQNARKRDLRAQVNRDGADALVIQAIKFYVEQATKEAA